MYKCTKLVCLFFCLTFVITFKHGENCEAQISFNDIEFFVGPSAGPNVNTAALVIDWEDGQDPLIWGYRWLDTETKTGQDMLLDIASADPRLTVDYPGYVREVTFDRGGGSSSSESYDFSDPFTGNFWGYQVNSPQTPGDFTSSAHGLPNGNPYAGGSWEFSNTGALDRPLFDGSFDGWLWFADATSALDTEPVPATIPEPDSIALVLIFVLISLARRRL